MNNELKIRTLLERFFDGETTLDEERQLYDYFRQQPDMMPDDLRQLREMFLDLSVLPTADLQPDSPSKPHSPSRWKWAAAAVAIMLLAGGAMTLFTHQSDDDELVAYVYGQRTTNREVVLTEMQKTMTALANDGSDIVEEQLRQMFSNP
ncbi:MAG: hypothetical protein K5683_03600 [Prevotella sp.]|nr:hypothetical protein [Prevotella sp.]